jgi:hypothetical protein
MGQHNQQFFGGKSQEHEKKNIQFHFVTSSSFEMARPGACDAPLFCGANGRI